VVTLTAVLTALALLFAGSVLHMALARHLLAFDEVRIGAIGEVSERDLLFFGFLPAFALVGTIGTYLALFRVFRPDITAAVLTAALLWRWRDTMATARAVRDLVTDGWSALRHFRIVAIAAMSGFAALTICLFFLAQIPAENVDVWVFQLPLAHSIVEHSGFFYPQIDHPFYSNNPLFFNLLYAQALLFVDHFIAANSVNIFIYLGFLLGLSTYARTGRALGFLLILYLIAGSAFFSGDSAMPMTDLSRSCFSVFALLFTDRYLQTNRLYDLIMAGVLAGAAVAGKYTELITVALIGVLLIPGLLKGRHTWIHAFIFAAALTIVAGYWYAKNLILFGNPVYPFIFAHPGLSDEWMAEFIHDMTQAMDPANRIFVTNLLTLHGWRDFTYIFYHWFIAGYTQAQIAALLIIAGLIVLRLRLAMLVLCVATMFVVWYTIMFSHIRWAVPAYLLFFSTAFISWALMFDTAVLAFKNRTVNWNFRTMAGTAVSLFWSRPWTVKVLALAMTFAFVSVFGIRLINSASALFTIPPWLDRNFVSVILGRQSIDDYLTTRRAGYAIYHYIAVNNLRTVFQPFDNGSMLYAAAYNGGKDGHWLLHYLVMPDDIRKTNEFLKQHSIRYFVYRSSLAPVEIERLGPSNVEMAYAIMKQILPKSRLILTDPFGSSLYEILEPPVGNP
jgi:hypothetical protein